jgi:hypothetical protein
VEVALLVDGFCGRLGVLEVAHEDAGVFHEDLTVVAQLEIRLRVGLTDSADLDGILPINGGVSDVLRHPVPLPDRHAERHEELEQLRGDRGRTRDG